MTSRLSPEDQARVDAVTSRGTYGVERKPFRGWVLLGVVFLVMVILGLVSLVLGLLYDVT